MQTQKVVLFLQFVVFVTIFSGCNSFVLKSSQILKTSHITDVPAVKGVNISLRKSEHMPDVFSINNIGNIYPEDNYAVYTSGYLDLTFQNDTNVTVKNNKDSADALLFKGYIINRKFEVSDSFEITDEFKSGNGYRIRPSVLVNKNINLSSEDFIKLSICKNKYHSIIYLKYLKENQICVTLKANDKSLSDTIKDRVSLEKTIEDNGEIRLTPIIANTQISLLSIALSKDNYLKNGYELLPTTSEIFRNSNGYIVTPDLIRGVGEKSTLEHNTFIIIKAVCVNDTVEMRLRYIKRFRWVAGLASPVLVKVTGHDKLFKFSNVSPSLGVTLCQYNFDNTKFKYMALTPFLTLLL